MVNDNMLHLAPLIAKKKTQYVISFYEFTTFLTLLAPSYSLTHY